MRRFARQLILEPIGKAGQEKLVASGARIVGEGLALETAATYVARGGSHLEAGGFHGHRQGFGFGHPEVNAPPADLFGVLGTHAAAFTGSAPWLAVGELDGRWLVLFRTEKGCEKCFTNALQGLNPGSLGPKAVRWGALAGWQYQRLLLGLDTAPLGGRMQSDDGAEAWVPFTAWRCERHPAR